MNQFMDKIYIIANAFFDFFLKIDPVGTIQHSLSRYFDNLSSTPMIVSTGFLFLMLFVLLHFEQFRQFLRGSFIAAVSLLSTATMIAVLTPHLPGFSPIIVTILAWSLFLDLATRYTPSFLRTANHPQE